MNTRLTLLAAIVLAALPLDGLALDGVERARERLERASQPGVDRTAELQGALDLATAELAKVAGLEAVKERGLEWLADGDAPTPPLPRGLLHVAAVAYCSLVPSRSIFTQAGAARRCGRLFERSAAADPLFEHGAPLRALAHFRRAAPAFVGGDLNDSVALAERAAAQVPSFAPNQLELAEARLSRDGDRVAWIARLERLLELRDDAVPSSEDAQRRAKAEARALLAKR